MRLRAESRVISVTPLAPLVSNSTNLLMCVEIVIKCSSTSRMNSEWMLSLSHDMKSRETVGFYKATKGGESPLVLQHLKLKACAPQIGNPFLLPVLILQETINSLEKRQRTIREDVQRLEAALYLGTRSQAGYRPLAFEQADVDIDFLNKGILDTSAQLSKESPSIYLTILDNLETAMKSYEAAILNKGGYPGQVHATLMSRLRLQQNMVQAMEQLHQSTTGRLNIQASTVSI
jgi:hypothetical protein